MKKIIALSILFSLLMLWNCRKSDDTLQIRVQNISGVKMNAVTYKPMYCAGSNAEDHNYGTLESGTVSEYQIYDKAYEDSGISVEINGQQYSITPTNCSGDPNMIAGKYNYQIGTQLDNNGNVVTLTLNLVHEADE